jgi:thiamine monophosphate synthase
MVFVAIAQRASLRHLVDWCFKQSQRLRQITIPELALLQVVAELAPENLRSPSAQALKLFLNEASIKKLLYFDRSILLVDRSWDICLAVKAKKCHLGPRQFSIP